MAKKKLEKPWYKRWWAIVLFVFVGLIILGSLFGSDNATSNNNYSNNQESEIQNNCVPDWQCTSWSECSEFERQTRTCSDNNNCGTNSGKPEVTQTCTYVVVEPEPITISGSGQQASEYF